MGGLDKFIHTIIIIFKGIAFLGFITTGGLTISVVYTKVYKKLMNFDEKKIAQNKPYFIFTALAIELVYIILYTILFR